MKKALFVLITLILASCTRYSPVTGIMGEGREVFLGTAARTFPSNSGVLTVTSNQGVMCSGKFHYYKGGKSGNGNFSCTDGRAGKYNFNSTGREGRGIGKTFDGEEVEFYFSKQPTEWNF